jgi:hypothetical protein
LGISGKTRTAVSADRNGSMELSGGDSLLTVNSRMPPGWKDLGLNSPDMT